MFYKSEYRVSAPSITVPIYDTYPLNELSPKNVKKEILEICDSDLFRTSSAIIFA
jgi:hypothetical protein